MNLETTSDTNWPKVSPSQQTPQYTTGVVRPETGLGTPDLLEGEDDEAEPPPPNDAANVATSGRLGQAAEAIVDQAEYSPVFCETPEGSSSGESMNNHVDNATPPESPSHAGSPGAGTAAQIGRLSLDTEHLEGYLQNGRGRGSLSGHPTTVSKRAASSELPRPPERQSPGWQTSNNPRQPARNQRGRNRPRKEHESNSKPNRFSADQNHERTPLTLLARDSGYDSMPSRKSTFQQQPLNRSTQQQKPHPSRQLPSLQEHPQDQSALLHKQRAFQRSARDRYPDLILQPDSSPISQDQLAAEVKGIYAGLVMVEAKCINIDAAQAADPKSFLGPEQWQALIALHRTLLYEHHDFLMATQHPSATPALRGLATKYSMPARMWRHGIHAFLEVLRHRRPESQDYMLAFIYLAYQMIALLFETVPTFYDTWIECLGDLARYRMAIEEEREAHTIWGGVASRWYTMASDRHPAIGRLYHHLGILERPSIRKFFLYAKSLTCVLPFSNARDSLVTLCGPIVQDKSSQSSNQSAEASMIKFHAFQTIAPDNSGIADVASDALTRLSRMPSAKVRDLGVPLIITNIAALLELGSSKNLLWQLFGKAINEVIQSSRPSAAASANTTTLNGNNFEQLSPSSGTSSSSLVHDFCYSSFNHLSQHSNDRQSVRDLLPSVHTVLVWLHSIHSLQSRVHDDYSVHTCSSLLSPKRFSWGGLSHFLNKLTEIEPITARTMEYARQGIFLTPEKPDDTKPLSEDYLIRGLIWTQFYFPSGWFNGQTDENGRSIETATMHKARVERVQWLGLHLAFRTDYIKFDVHTKGFWAPATGSPIPPQPEQVTPFQPHQEQRPKAPTPKSRSSTTLSAHSDSEGYTLVNSSKSKPARTWANVASKPIKHRQDYEGVRIVNDDGMEWEA